MRKDLTLGLGSMADHTPYNLCTPLLWTITLNSRNLDQLIGLRFLMSTILILFLNIFLGHGLHLQPPEDLDMVIQKQWCLHLIQIMLVRTPRLPYTCIPPSILVSILECLLFILMNMFTNLFHRYEKSFNSTFLVFVRKLQIVSFPLSKPYFF